MSFCDSLCVVVCCVVDFVVLVVYRTVCMLSLCWLWCTAHRHSRTRLTNGHNNYGSNNNMTRHAHVARLSLVYLRVPACTSTHQNHQPTAHRNCGLALSHALPGHPHAHHAHTLTNTRTTDTHIHTTHTLTRARAHTHMHTHTHTHTHTQTTQHNTTTDNTHTHTPFLILFFLFYSMFGSAIDTFYCATDTNNTQPQPQQRLITTTTQHTIATTTRMCDC